MNRYLLYMLVSLLASSIGFTQTFDDYFKIAAENNPGLMAEFNEYESALQRVSQVNSLPDPTLSLGFFISPVETRVGPQTFKLSISQMFPWFGVLKAKGDAASLLAEAKYQNFIDARNRLRLQVASAYYPFFELMEWIRIEQENVAILETYKTIAIQKFNDGSGSMVDVLRVDIMLKDAETALEILKAKEAPMRVAFNKILNRPENEEVIISDNIRIMAMPENFRKDSLLTSNPRIKSLSLKLLANEALERAALKQGFPKLGIGLDYVVVGQGTNQSVTDNGKDIIMPMATVSIPIFRSKYRAAVNEARFKQKSVRNRIQQESNSLLSDYEMAMFNIHQQAKLFELYEQQIKTTKHSLSLLLTSYANSGKDFEEVLRMQQLILKYEKLKVSALAQYQVAIERINYLTSNIY